MLRRSRFGSVALLAVALAFPSCTIVVHDPGPGKTVEPLRAHMLWAVSVDRSAVNLALEYETLIRELMLALAVQDQPVLVEKIAIVPLDRTFGSGPRLIYGENVTLPPLDDVFDLFGLPGGGETKEPGDDPEGTGELGQGMEPPDQEWPDGGDLPGTIEDWNGREGALALTIAAAAGSPLFEPFPENTPEQISLASVGRTLGAELVLDANTWIPGARPFFDDPPDVLIVGTLGHLRRRCALDDAACRIEQLAPDAYFAAADGKGADWIRYGGDQRLDPRRIFHLSFVTAERRDEERFYRECSGLPGFPQALLDSMEPSPVAYYGQFAERLSSRIPGRAIYTDLCVLLGSTRTARLLLHAQHIANAASEGG